MTTFNQELIALEESEPFLRSCFPFLPRPTCETSATIWQLAIKLACAPSSPQQLRQNAPQLRELLWNLLAELPSFSSQLERDIQATLTRDPACRGRIYVVLFYKGFLALQCYRFSHHLWEVGRIPLALWLQSRCSEVFGVDIHPGARLGSGIFIDHATSIVIGETSVVEDDVSILHEVTLGGTGKQSGDRHPKVRRGVMIGAGVKVLGNIELGEYSKIGAGSVVLRSVPPHTTAVGVPARVIGSCSCEFPADEMDQWVEG